MQKAHEADAWGNSKRKSTMLRITSFNANSLAKRKTEIFQFITEEDIDIMCIQETWMSLRSEKPHLPGFSWVGTNPTNRKGSGVGIFIKNSIKFEVIEICQNTELMEFIGIRVHIRGGKYFTLLNIYQHPMARKLSFKKIKRLNISTSVICGDFNAHKDEWSLGSENKFGRELKEFTLKKEMVIISNKDCPTLINRKTKKLSSPDLFMVSRNISNRVGSLKVGSDLGSDHLPLLLTLQLDITKVVPKEVYFWRYKRLDQKKFEICLGRLLKEWQLKNNEVDISKSYEEWTTAVLRAANSHCPKTLKKGKLKANPWWNLECQKEVTLRRKLRRKYQKKRGTREYLEYRIQDKKSKRTILEAKRKYWKNLCSNLDCNTVFQHLKRISGRSNLANPVKDSEESVLTDNTAIANAIGKFFSSLGEKETRRIPIEGHSIPENFTKECEEKIKEVEIIETIKNLNIKKAVGPDSICPFMVKLGGPAISKSLETLFNWVLNTGKSPDQWHKAIIVPIPKNKKLRIAVDEFRPISLTSTVAKIFESIMNKRLTNLAKKQNWIPDFQFGFRKGYSTIDNLINVQQHIHTAFKQRKIILAAFLDIKKAYDCVDRKLLYSIIKDFGVNGKVSSWLKDFLEKVRESRIRYKNSYSKEFSFNRGVPQGSPLSPLLFNIYAMRLGTIFKSNILQYADDIMLWETGENVDEVEEKLNSSINKIHKWATDSGLTFANKKCEIVPFTRKRNLRSPIIKLDGQNLKVVDSVKYLGVHLDTKLCWKQQIEYIRKKATQRLALLKKISKKSQG